MFFVKLVIPTKKEEFFMNNVCVWWNIKSSEPFLSCTLYLRWYSCNLLCYHLFQGRVQDSCAWMRGGGGGRGGHHISWRPGKERVITSPPPPGGGGGGTSPSNCIHRIIYLFVGGICPFFFPLMDLAMYILLFLKKIFLSLFHSQKTPIKMTFKFVSSYLFEVAFTVSRDNYFYFNL